MQRMCAPLLAMNETASHYAQTFWKNQDKILRSMQELAQEWFERRHKAAETALSAVDKMTEAKAPTDMLQEYQTWMMGSYERLLADGAACQKHLMNVTEAMVAQLPEGGMPSRAIQTPVAQSKQRRPEAA
jgi:hypothetical protein